jgi:hypothetical protein
MSFLLSLMMFEGTIALRQVWNGTRPWRGSLEDACCPACDGLSASMREKSFPRMRPRAMVRIDATTFRGPVPTVRPRLPCCTDTPAGACGRGARHALTLPALRHNDDEPRQLRPAVSAVVDACCGHGTFLDAGELHL